MRKTVLLIILLIGSLRVSGQPLRAAQLADTWIGVHTEWDSTYVCPLAAYLTLGADSTYGLGLIDGAVSERKATWAVNDSIIRLDSIRFKSRLITIRDNLLRIGINYPMVFRRFTDIPLDSAGARQQLAGRVWQSDSLTIQLFANGRTVWENRTSKQRTGHFWHIVRFRESLFLVVAGNATGPEGGYKSIFQLSRLTPRRMDVIGWNGNRVAATPFGLVRALTPSDSLQPLTFQTCQNCHKAILSIFSITHGQQRYDVLQAIAQHYHPEAAARESGIVQVRFVRNCTGQKGLFRVRGWDEQYRIKTFDTSITGQLMTICREYIGQEQDNSSEDDSRDTTFVLTFRLQNGRITDLLS